MMLGLPLARSGIRVKVLEKHSDFFRDFRGDTMHPSTLEILDALGMLDEFLRLPHQEVRELRGQIGDTTLRLADFTHLKRRARLPSSSIGWQPEPTAAAAPRCVGAHPLSLQHMFTPGRRPRAPSGCARARDANGTLNEREAAATRARRPIAPWSRRLALASAIAFAISIVFPERASLRDTVPCGDARGDRRRSEWRSSHARETSAILDS
jgi:hypothetical protein